MQSGITQENTENKDEAQALAQRLDSAVQSGPEVAAEHDFGAPFATRVTLQKPIERASREMEPVSRLYLREPKAGDLRGIKLTDLLVMDAAALLPLLERIAMPRLAPAELQKLGYADTLALYAAVNSFL
ncbi:phage tail assembly protein [Ottowia sp. oral taxon 894]|uniref:phage tail assembly protein n=1 Tax=Ottowia sp. oral taxon 894 TaxID=1658672 RepID=UPI0012E188A2|nr:phage tail assembly protein [Ottowia sp. oral taxon 894]